MKRRDALLCAAATLGAAFAAREMVRRARRFELRGKVVLVTGGSRGLGLLLAREFARRGARVAICARDEKELERAQELLDRGASAVLTLTCDLSNRESVDETIAETERRLGPLDVLVNNAGVIQVGPLDVMTIEDYQEALDTHFWGALHTILAVLPSMRRRQSGRIVNIVSIGGKVSVPHLVPYNASKFALYGLSTGLRAELAGTGVLVTTICPGLMRTGSPVNATFKGQHRKEYAWFSVSDALPLVSMNAERAARKIVDACVDGRAELTLTPMAKLAAAVYALFPGLTQDVLGLGNRLMPASGGIGTGRARGRESTSRVSPSVLTTLGDRAAERYNEL